MPYTAGMAFTPQSTAQYSPQAGVIDFGIGQPDPSLLPLELMRDAAADRLGDGDPSYLAYGAEQGDALFRQALAGFLSQQLADQVDADELFVTAGVSSALDLLCTLYTQPGDTVFVEEPSYFLALRIFADHKLEVVSLPMDEHGLDIDALEAALQRTIPVMVYTIPTFHNPAGVTLPHDRRERLAMLAEKHGFAIVADEVYQLLGYTETPPPPMATYSNTAAIFSLGSFSKILAPGVRLGWIQSAAEHFPRLTRSGLLLSGGGMNPLVSGIVRSLLESGKQAEHLTQLRKVYASRLDALSQAIADFMPDDVSYAAPTGGYFAWLGLPEHIDARALRDKTRAVGVTYQPGIKFSSRDALTHCARLCFAYHPEDELREGVQRLAKLLGEVR